MQFSVVDQSPEALAYDALVVPVFADGKLEGAAAEADRLTGGAIAGVIASGELSGARNETALIHSGTGIKRTLVVGLGDRAKFSLSQLSRYAGTAVRYLGRRKIRRIAIALPPEARADAGAAASFIIEGGLAATIDTTVRRSKLNQPTGIDDRPIEVPEIALLSRAGDERFETAALEAGIRRGAIVGEAVNFARKLALEPANFMTPRILAENAQALADENELKIDVLDELRMKDLGMGSLLGVAKGSDEPPRMIVIEYNGDPGSSEKLALVGKGITFDSGGISLKPGAGMEDMKYDMSGAAAVIAAIGAIAKLKLKANVVAIAPATENLPGGSAQKPGDVVTAMDGQTIEVINTDAEGRLILADGLGYARKLGATKIIDCATLTGSIVVALGHEATGVMTNDDAFAADFLSAANGSGERYWHLPLYDEFTTTVKSEVADWRNSTGREAGSLTAAAFLKAFAHDTPWIHLDIAGTAYVDKAKAYAAKGPTGYPVKALVAYVESIAR